MFRRLRHQMRGISPDEAVYLIDVTETWNKGGHAYWAFTEPSWFAWALEGGPLPSSLRKASPDDPLKNDPSAEERIGYVVGGALVQGAFVGRGAADLDAWLGGREPLGTLSMTEVEPPFGTAGAPVDDGSAG